MSNAAKDVREESARAQFVKFTQEYPDLAEWCRLGLDGWDAPRPGAQVNGRPVTVALLVEARFAMKRLCNQWAVKRALAEHSAGRDYIQDRLDEAVGFHDEGKYLMILNGYFDALLGGKFDALDADCRWLLDTAYRVAMEPGQWGGPNVKIAHDLMVDLIRAGGGPLLSYSTVVRRSKDLGCTPHVAITKGFLSRDGKRIATRYTLPLEPSPPRVRTAGHSAYSHGGDWLCSWSTATGDLDVQALLIDATRAKRATGRVEPLGPAVPRLTVEQVVAYGRYTVELVSPSKARRLGGKYLADYVAWCIANNVMCGEQFDPELVDVGEAVHVPTIEVEENEHHGNLALPT